MKIKRIIISSITNVTLCGLLYAEFEVRLNNHFLGVELIQRQYIMIPLTNN